MNIEPVINARFKRFKEQYNLVKMNEGGAFERFVNFNILYAHNTEAFLGNSDFLDFCSVGGSNDLGIDGIGIKLNGVFVRSNEDVEDILGKNKKAYVEFIFIQSKYKDKFDMGEYNNFIAGVRDFLSDKQLQPTNDKVKKLIEIKEYILSEDIMVIWEKNPSIRLYYVTMGKKDVLPHIDALGAQFKKDIIAMNTYEEIFIHLTDCKALKEICDNNTNSFNEVIEVIESMPLTFVENVENSCMALCFASEIDKLIRTSDGVIRKSLFNDNVRDFQGDTTVNYEMKKTIFDEPQKFVLLNNGITIVCDEYKPNNRKITLNNPQIVNGCQTSHVLFYAKQQKHDISTVPVSIKIIATQDDFIINQIVRGTNKQNIVYDEAFEIIRDYHKELEEIFPNVQNPKNITLYYERRSKQYQSAPVVRQEQKVSFRLLIQGFIAMYLNEPENAYRHESKLIRDYKKKVFLESHSKMVYYMIGLFGYYIDLFFRQKPQLSKEYKGFKYHIMMLSRLIINDKMPSINKEKEIDQYCMGVINEMCKNYPAIIQKAINRWEECKIIWTNKMKKSVYGIKDVSEFTKLLLEKSEKNIQGIEPIVAMGVVNKVMYDKFNYFCGFIKSTPSDIFFHERSNPKLDFPNIEGRKVTYQVQEYKKQNGEITNVAIDMRIIE